jgi:hypothetical protein
MKLSWTSYIRSVLGAVFADARNLNDETLRR